MAIDVKGWASRFRSLTDNDPTIGAMAKYYTCTFMFDMTERKVIVEMHDGKVKHINTDPQPLEPGEIVKLEIEILPFSNVFKKGHRLRLEISNGDSPITDGLFTHQYSWFKVGRDTIHHDAQHASRLIVPIASGA